MAGCAEDEFEAWKVQEGLEILSVDHAPSPNRLTRKLSGSEVLGDSLEAHRAFPAGPASFSPPGRLDAHKQAW